MSKLHHLLETAATAHPDKTAVEDPEKSVEINYGDMNILSDRLREVLVRNGVGPGDRVGVCIPKSIGAVISIFGILKSESAYVPVAVDSPPARNAYVFEDCSVRAIIVDQEFLPAIRSEFTAAGIAGIEDLETLEDFGRELVVVRMEEERGSGNPTVSGTTDLAYILYTSGSTGRPKGVMHTHATALSFIHWCSDVLEPTQVDRFSSHAPFHFDLSILDIYVPLKHGATVVLIGETPGKQPRSLAELISNQSISVWYSTPSVMRMLVEYGRMNRYDYSALRIVLFAGEVFPIKHLHALKKAWPQPRFLNLYGPTETNVCTYYEVPDEIAEKRKNSLPIGRKCSGDETMIADPQGLEVDAGTEGELYVSGGSVMIGYWNLPDQNAKAFHVDDLGQKWYKTGDIVRQDSEGEYLFVGRRDGMVKRRGFRVEIGEVESALYRHPSILEAAVVALPDDANGVLLKAFLGCGRNERPSLIELKQFCNQVLPSYMIPDQFLVLPELPKTSTDKIDVQRLSENY